MRTEKTLDLRPGRPAFEPIDDDVAVDEHERGSHRDVKRGREVPTLVEIDFDHSQTTLLLHRHGRDQTRHPSGGS